MNPSFFGLEGHPFDRARAEGDAFLSDAHSALTAELHAGLKAPHGITLLIGDEGSGKSTLAGAFASQLADTATVAYLPTTGPGLRHLLTEIIEQLGGSDSAATEEQALLDELTRLARARAEHDRITLIILDDAHELPAKTIERLGKLFGDDPAEPSMLHIILVGRGELLDRMNAANDRSILKHLVQVCRMDPIGPEESFRYIADRISKVGGVVDSLFTEDALHMIVKRANGFPARIDAICTASLDYAEGRGDSNVGTDIVDLACSGADGFAFEETTPGGSASYFLAEDGESDADKMDEPELDHSMQHATSASAPRSDAPVTGGSSTDASGAGSRRRLALWAIGLIGVVGLFAATMSGTGTDDDLSGLGSAAGDGQQLAALPPEDKVDGSVPAEPVAAPKLNLSKQTTPAGGTAAAAKAEKKKQILDSLQDSATPRRATAPVHATPRPPAVGTPAAAIQPARAATGNPTAAPTGQAAATAITPQPAGTQVAAARPRVQSPRYAPAAKMAPAAPKPVVAPAKASPPPVPSKPAPAAAAPPKVVQPAPIKKAQAPKPRPAAAPVPTQPRVPVVAPPTASRPARPAAPAPTRVAAAPAPTGAANALPRKYYTVQLGAFGSRANAESLLAKVRTKYSDGRIIAASESGKTVFRVVSGTFTEMAAAKGRADSLSSGGFSTYVRSVGK